MALTYKVLFPSISTCETPPCCTSRAEPSWVRPCLKKLSVYGNNDNCGPAGRRNAVVESRSVLLPSPAFRQASVNSDAICSAKTPSPCMRTPKRASFSLPPRIARIRLRILAFFVGACWLNQSSNSGPIHTAIGAGHTQQTGPPPARRQQESRAFRDRSALGSPAPLIPTPAPQIGRALLWQPVGGSAGRHAAPGRGREVR